MSAARPGTPAPADAGPAPADASQGLPSYVQAAEHGRGWIGHLVTRFHLQAWVNRNAPKLQSLGTTLAKPALTAGRAWRRCWPRSRPSSP